MADKRTIENAFKTIGRNVTVIRESPTPGKQGSYYIDFHGKGDDRCVEVAQKLQDTYGFYCNPGWVDDILGGHLELIDGL